jgi:MYXO-CTERM domain-containing protein
MSLALDHRGARDLAVDSVRAILDRSFAPWELVDCSAGANVGLSVRVLNEAAECDGAEFNQNGAGNVNAVTFVDNWRDRGYPESAMALTFVWFSKFRGEIFDADIEVNQESFRWFDCDDVCPPGQADLQNALTHEAGHFFGLGHSSVREATMAPGAVVGEVVKRSLEQDDVLGICDAYDPMNVDPQCDDEPVDGLQLVCGSEPGCGCRAVGASPAHGHEPFWLAGTLVVLAIARRRVRTARRTVSAPRRSARARSRAEASRSA